MIHVYELSELIFLLVERLRQPSKYDSTGLCTLREGGTGQSRLRYHYRFSLL